MVPILGLDYFFITAEGVVSWLELLKMLGLNDGDDTREEVQQMIQDRKIIKCLIACDYESKAVFATVIAQKGHDDNGYAANFILEVVKWLGYTTIMVKSDNEPAMLRLVKVAVEKLRTRLATVREEHSKEYDSQSHGATETRIRSVRMYFRTLRHFFEAQLGRKVPIDHPVMAWLLSWTATLQNIVARGPDGKTPWSRIKGRPFNGRLGAFGEICRFKLPGRGPLVKDKGNMVDQSEEGVFLGVNWNMNEYIYSTPSGIRGSRSLTRVPYEHRWSLDALAAITATPWQLEAPHDPDVIFPEEVPKEAPPKRDVIPVRRLKITAEDLKRYGLTHGCPQCDHIREYGQHRPGCGHSNPCRDRILTEMAKTPEGLERLRRVEERANSVLAKYVEQHAADEQRLDMPDAVIPGVKTVGHMGLNKLHVLTMN